MDKLGLNEIREKYLSFFESKEHYRLPSFPLVPQSDKGLLLINSGMAPLKPYFTGQAVPPSNRVTTCQKCIRTPDIERVGKTSRHGTFFEMLGNFSFGDYFKVEATAWAWEFITEVVKLPVDRLWVSIYLDDDEAFEIWTKNVGVAPERIVRLGKADNFWEIGAGPCGPCSEIYFDRGEEYGCENENCAVGCDCDRYVEFWNLVFTQFDSDGNGKYTRLAKPNIDTGMGLERIACICQGVDNLFEVDTIKEICLVAAKIAGVEYHQSAKTDVSLRIITDHIRSTTMMIADGVLPSNEGRGYVLRRLLRRAARHGKLLGITKLFLCEQCEVVIKNSGKAYPELVEKHDYIKKIITLEEERFNETIDSGLSILNGHIEELKAEGKTCLDGAKAFKLYDTFGFPIDLTREILEEQGLTLNEEEFTAMMNEQKQRARSARMSQGDAGWSKGALSKLVSLSTEFVGYAEYATSAKILAVIKDDELADGAQDGDNVSVILDKTPFYAESGGQVGDTGWLTKGDSKMKVLDTVKTPTGKTLHVCEVTDGSFMTGDTVEAGIDVARRQAIIRNHSSAHLLQAALRRVLGTHVEQAGSYVDEHRVRFDFTHFAAMTAEELSKVEADVNTAILTGLQNDIREMSMDEAKKLGAMALFGEKYGNLVRVVKMGDYSTELCGGCHVDNTAKVGLFKVVSETSVAAGVRRIEGTTGLNVLGLVNEKQGMIEEAAVALKASPAELVRKAEAVAAELKALGKELEAAKAHLAGAKTGDLLENAEKVAGLLVVTAKFEADGNELRTIGDSLRDKSGDVVAALAGVKDGKGSIVVVCGKNAVAKGMHAGNIVKTLAGLTGGSGGGKPDGAMGSCKEVSKIDAALKELGGIVASSAK